MKLYLNIIAIVLVAMVGKSDTTASDLISRGRQYLTVQNYSKANELFASAIKLEPTNEVANVLLAFTRLVSLPQLPAVSNFLNQAGITSEGRSVVDWTATLKQDVNGEVVLPSDNTAVASVFLKETLLPELAKTAVNLSFCKNLNFRLALNADETQIQSVTLDFGDVQLLRSLVTLAQSGGYLVTAQDAAVLLPILRNMYVKNELTAQSVLEAYPKLLTLANPSDLIVSKSAFSNAVEFYFAASDFIRNQRIPGGNPLFAFDTENAADVEAEFQFGEQLKNILLSLNEPVALRPITIQAINSDYSLNFSRLINNYPYLLDYQPFLYLGRLFSSANPIRSLLPRFSGNSYVRNSLPDYTMGGIISGVSDNLVEVGLRRAFSDFAGVYINQDYWDAPFAAIIGTNRQVRVFYFQDSNGYYYSQNSVSIPSYVEFSIDDNGGWVFPENGAIQVTHPDWGYTISSGSVNSSGDFSGELVLTNGQSLWLWGKLESSGGFFDTRSGFYEGSSTRSDIPKTLGIMGLYGDFYECGLDKNGVPVDGFFGQFKNSILMASDYYWYENPTQIKAYEEDRGRVVSGKFKKQVGPSYSFSMSRNDWIPRDEQPLITSPLKVNGIPGGSNVVLSITASGSPKLRYQWQFNGINLYAATNNSLTTGVISPDTISAYSVIVANNFGSVSSSSSTTEVYQYPYIYIQPTSLTVSALDTATFNVGAAGSDTLRYQWKYFGANIPGATNSSYSIKSVKPSDLGNYYVVVSNSFGGVSSALATLAMKPYLAAPFAGASANYGDKIELGATAWGSGPLTYQWYQNGQALEKSGIPLRLNSANFHNGGSYTLVVSSPYGSVTNDSQYVDVLPVQPFSPVTLSLTLLKQGSTSVSGGVSTTAAPTPIKLATKDVLAMLAKDEYLKGNWPSNSFPQTATLALAGDAFFVIDGTNALLNVMDILDLEYGDPQVTSGSRNVATGLASTTAGINRLANIVFNDTDIKGGYQLHFYLYGVFSMAITDTVPSSGVYTETLKIKSATVGGDGYSQNVPLTCTGTISVSGKGTLKL
jgi:hypothetical protein